MIKVLRHSAVFILRHNNAQNDGGGRAYCFFGFHTIIIINAMYIPPGRAILLFRDDEFLTVFIIIIILENFKKTFLNNIL